MNEVGNHYERAFESWLKDNGIQYLLVDQQKRTAFSKSKIKSFDFLFYTPDSKAYIAEVKGRKFSGKTFTAFGSLANWVTIDDVKGLENWVKIFGKNYQGPEAALSMMMHSLRKEASALLCEGVQGIFLNLSKFF